MTERSTLISRLMSEIEFRTSYIRAKLGTLVPAQIRALRLKSNMPRQSDLAREANMQQSRISMFETPGAANMTLETLARLAAAFKVGMVVKFVPFSVMLQWENEFSLEGFDVRRLEEDTSFVTPRAASVPVSEKAFTDVNHLITYHVYDVGSVVRTNLPAIYYDKSFQQKKMPSVQPFAPAIHAVGIFQPNDYGKPIETVSPDSAVLVGKDVVVPSRPN